LLLTGMRRRDEIRVVEHFTDGIECGVDREVHATAGRAAGATGSRPIGTVQAIGNGLYTNRQNALESGE